MCAPRRAFPNARRMPAALASTGAAAPASASLSGPQRPTAALAQAAGQPCVSVPNPHKERCVRPQLARAPAALLMQHSAAAPAGASRGARPAAHTLASTPLVPAPVCPPPRPRDSVCDKKTPRRAGLVEPTGRMPPSGAPQGGATRAAQPAPSGGPPWQTPAPPTAPQSGPPPQRWWPGSPPCSARPRPRPPSPPARPAGRTARCGPAGAPGGTCRGTGHGRGQSRG